MGDRSQDVDGSGETNVDAPDGNGSVEHFHPDHVGLGSFPSWAR